MGTWMLIGTHKIKLITNTTVPKDRDVTYGKIVCDIRMHKKETHQCRLTVVEKKYYPDNEYTN